MSKKQGALVVIFAGVVAITAIFVKQLSSKSEIQDEGHEWQGKLRNHLSKQKERPTTMYFQRRR